MFELIVDLVASHLSTGEIMMLVGCCCLGLVVWAGSKLGVC